MANTPKAVEKYFEIYNDTSDMGEIEWRRIFEKYILRDLLGYPSKNIRFEKDRTDLRIIDDDGRSHIVIETKIVDGHLELPETTEQAFGYVRGGEVFVITASPKRMMVYDPVGKIKGRIFIESITEPLEGIHWEISYENMVAEGYMDTFKSGRYEFCYIKTEEDLGKLIENLHVCNSLLTDYAGWAWAEYARQYEEEFLPGLQTLEETLETVESLPLNDAIIKEKVRFIKTAIRHHKIKYAVPVEIFENSYPAFKDVQPFSSGRSEKDFAEIYLNDVVYAALNRVLFIRIAEDKELIGRKISNGGIGVWRSFVNVLENKYPELLRVAYRDTAGIYRWFFEPGIFDWYIKDGTELDKVLTKVFFILNAFDFKGLDQNLLAELYQEYLPPAKRKKLGEFYTPAEVVEYILNKTGYAGDGKVLDFACGSGGFLVPAARRKLEAGKAKGLTASARLRSLADVVGFDINPFATHIATMNMLFLVLDTLEEGRRREDKPELPMFNIFNLDSLVGISNLKNDAMFADVLKKGYLSSGEVHRAAGDYDYVVGNPPYVRNERLPEDARLAYASAFQVFKSGNTDIFNYFIVQSFDWLEDGGKLGVIISMGLADADASSATRQFLNTWQIDEVVPLEWCEVFTASVNPIILIMTKKLPGKEHKVRLVQGVRSLDGFDADDIAVSEINQREWTELAPDGSWRLDIRPDDLPIIEKLKKMPTPLKAAWGAARRTAAGEREIVSEDPSGFENPVKVLDGREIRAWSIEWQGRYLDYVPELLSDPKTPEFFADSVVLVPNISLTTQAVFNATPKETYFFNTIMGCKIDDAYDLSDPYITAALINTEIARYYLFLCFRAGVMEGSRRCHFYTRVLNAIPLPKEKNINDAREIAQLSKSAHDVAATMVHGDKRIIEEVEKTVTGYDPFAKHASADFRGYNHALDLETAEIYGDGILLDSPPETEELFGVTGDPYVLRYILYRATLEGKHDKLSQKTLEEFPIPVDSGELNAALTIFERWAEEKPGLGGELRETEAEINELAFDLYGFTKKEKEYIKRRCSEFPMSEVLKTELPGSPVRRIRTRVYEPDERYA